MRIRLQFSREKKILTGARKKEAKTDISHYKCEYVSSEVGQATLNYNLQLQWQYVYGAYIHRIRAIILPQAELAMPHTVVR